MGNATMTGVMRGHAGRVLLSAVTVTAIALSTGPAQAACVPHSNAHDAFTAAPRGEHPNHHHEHERIIKGRKVG
jgi:hypothetical protein